MKKYICFRCGEPFKPSNTCNKCSWYICPHCNACLCTLNDKEKFVAVAVWLTHSSISDETYESWLNYLRKLKKKIEKSEKTSEQTLTSRGSVKNKLIIDSREREELLREFKRRFKPHLLLYEEFRRIFDEFGKKQNNESGF